MKKKLFLSPLLYTACLFLCGCGFHLRSNSLLTLHLHSLYIESPAPYSLFNKALLTRLHQLGVTTQTHRQQARYTLAIFTAKFSRQNNNAFSYASVQNLTLQYEIRYQLQDPAGNPLTRIHYIKEHMSYQYNQHLVGASNQQMQPLKRKLMHHAIESLMQRLHNFHLKPVKRGKV